MDKQRLQEIAGIKTRQILKEENQFIKNQGEIEDLYNTDEQDLPYEELANEIVKLTGLDLDQVEEFLDQIVDISEEAPEGTFDEWFEEYKRRLNSQSKSKKAPRINENEEEDEYDFYELKEGRDYGTDDERYQEELDDEKYKRAYDYMSDDDSDLEENELSLFDMMDGQANIQALDNLKDALSLLVHDWLEEGFEKEDIQEYMNILINQIK